jgi:AcrR family transcriptional regulator
MDRRELRRKRKQDQVREEILAAAGRVLLEQGLGKLTLAAVARELQLSKAALYHYFASKKELVFELIFRSLERHCIAVETAVKKASSGPDALEALIRSAAAYYREHPDEYRLAYLVPQAASKGAVDLDAEDLERIRPINDRIFGSVADKIREDQAAGKVAAAIDGRRLAFVAHTSVLGIITIEGIVKATNDAPLMHAEAAMVNELVLSFRARLTLPR